MHGRVSATVARVAALVVVFASGSAFAQLEPLDPVVEEVCTVLGCEPSKFPATGQTTCWDSSGNSIPCPGTGQDGEPQFGGDLDYTDNGDGTITDKNTGLMWKKKDDAGGVHDRDNNYSWANALAVFIPTLNNRCANYETVNCSSDADCAAVGGSCGFAGHRDCRVPNVKELQSIVNYGVYSPAVDPAFRADRSRLHYSSISRAESEWLVQPLAFRWDLRARRG